ncbi:MAG TPA: glycosyltransferase family 4 protein [Xanthobacteraceae bacterium]|nr:glycosyltransferase family 4 protein [Xanthobacteraceae bacterium]
MKILHAILSDGFYGSERYCIEVATAQARAGHRVKVLVANGESDCARAFRREIEHTTAAIAADGTAGAIDLIALPGWLPTLLHRAYARRALTRFAPDIVHSHLNPAARRVGQVAQRLGIAHVATMHIRYEPREHGGCDGLICYTNGQRSEVDPRFPGETAIVGAWVAEPIHAGLARATPVDVAALRSTWNADDHTVVLGSVGRLMPEKGMDVLVQAFRSAFPSGNEPVRLVIVGGGPPDQAQQLHDLAGGDTRITLNGPPPDIALYYRAFDTYVSAARYEPFGLTILEAMASGTALVVTRTRGPQEFLREPSVMWAEPGDVATLAAQLRIAASRGRERASYDLSPYTQRRAVTQIEELYARVLARRRTSPKN